MGDGCAVVDTIALVGVEVDMVVVHGCRGPLDMCHCRGGVGVFIIIQGTFISPAGDVEGFVLFAIGKVD